MGSGLGYSGGTVPYGPCIFPEPAVYHLSSRFWVELALSPGRASPVFSRVSSPTHPNSYQHLLSPHHLEWGRRHSEPHVTLPGPQLGLTRRCSEPSYLPSASVSWGCVGANLDMELGPEGLSSKVEDVGGSSRKPLSLSCESSGALQVGTSGI